MTETVQGQEMLKCSQPSPIMPLHQFAKPSISCLVYFLYHPYIMHFLIGRIIIYLYNYSSTINNSKYSVCSCET